MRSRGGSAHTYSGLHHSAVLQGENVVASTITPWAQHERRCVRGRECECGRSAGLARACMGVLRAWAVRALSHLFENLRRLRLVLTWWRRNLRCDNGNDLLDNLGNDLLDTFAESGGGSRGWLWQCGGEGGVSTGEVVQQADAELTSVRAAQQHPSRRSCPPQSRRTVPPPRSPRSARPWARAQP